MIDDAGSSVPEPYIRLISAAQASSLRSPDHPYNPGVVPVMGRLLMTHSRIGPAIDTLQTELMFGPGALQRSERELLAVVASVAQDCHY